MAPLALAFCPPSALRLPSLPPSRPGVPGDRGWGSRGSTNRPWCTAAASQFCASRLSQRAETRSRPCEPSLYGCSSTRPRTPCARAMRPTARSAGSSTALALGGLRLGLLDQRHVGRDVHDSVGNGGLCPCARHVRHLCPWSPTPAPRCVSSPRATPTGRRRMLPTMPTRKRAWRSIKATAEPRRGSKSAEPAPALRSGPV